MHSFTLTTLPKSEQCSSVTEVRGDVQTRASDRSSSHLVSFSAAND